jgi:hypothetical protein
MATFLDPRFLRRLLRTLPGGFQLPTSIAVFLALSRG